MTHKQSQVLRYYSRTIWQTITANVLQSSFLPHFVAFLSSSPVILCRSQYKGRTKFKNFSKMVQIFHCNRDVRPLTCSLIWSSKSKAIISEYCNQHNLIQSGHYMSLRPCPWETELVLLLLLHCWKHFHTVKGKVSKFWYCVKEKLAIWKFTWNKTDIAMATCS